MASRTIAAPAPTTDAAPWYVWCSVAAVTFAMVGVHWDISWHRSIGRDTFWTPAHICIHLCGVLAGISCAFLILSTTFSSRSPLRDCGVRVWGFRGPLGAFLAAWGGIAMLTSAPFDDWWHNAYGLDVKIISPPHMVLATGMMAVHLGALILIAGQMNRESGELRKRLLPLFLYVAGMVLVCLTVLQMEITTRSHMHTAHFFRLIAMIVPLPLAAAARATSHRWAATTVAGIYFVFVLLMSWILPIFPAEPKLGPVFYPLTQFAPPEFPLLLFVPAIALDLLWTRMRSRGILAQAAVGGVVFVAVFAAVQWPFADFLMLPAARNWFFGTKYFGYYVSPNSVYRTYRFLEVERGAEFWQESGLALVTAMATCWLGLTAGKWLSIIRR